MTTEIIFGIEYKVGTKAHKIAKDNERYVKDLSESEVKRAA